MRRQNQARICAVGCGVDAHATSLTTLFLGLAIGDNTDTQSATSGIQTTSNHGGAFGNASESCGFLGDFADHIVALANFRQEGAGNAQFGTHSVVPLHGTHIEAVQTIALGDFLGQTTGEAVSDVAVGLENSCNLAVDFRHLFLVPQDFTGGVGSLQGVTRQIEDVVGADSCVDLSADFLRTVVHPDGVVGQNLAVFVQGNGRPALAVNTDTRDVSRVDARFFNDSASGRCHSGPPFFRVLFHPAGVRIIDRIVAIGSANHVAVQVKDGNFASTCADVNTE